ncbi:MAG: GntR family transcriptional regulator [Alphaproteobacteria bacterium]|nr:MAG: GntR family transcriptional regulator [Alphaproteobacteria bacterium]
MYVQIMDHIRQKIEIGDWRAGDQLPSIRELAVSLKISVITVKRAYLELEHAGVIVTQHGKGSFVADATERAQPGADQALDVLLQQAAALARAQGLDEGALIARLKQLKNKEETE